MTKNSSTSNSKPKTFKQKMAQLKRELKAQPGVVGIECIDEQRLGLIGFEYEGGDEHENVKLHGLAAMLEEGGDLIQLMLSYDDISYSEGNESAKEIDALFEKLTSFRHEELQMEVGPALLSCPSLVIPATIEYLNDVFNYITINMCDWHSVVVEVANWNLTAQNAYERIISKNASKAISMLSGADVIEIISNKKKADGREIKFKIEIPSMNVDYVGHATISQELLIDYTIETKDQINEIPSDMKPCIEALVSQLIDGGERLEIKIKKSSIMIGSHEVIHSDRSGIFLLTLHLADIVPIINMVLSGEITVEEAVADPTQYGLFGDEFNDFLMSEDNEIHNN